MTPAVLLGVSLAGGVGALLRFVVDGALSTRWPAPFPYATLLINTTGSLGLGVLTGLVLFHGASASLATVLGVGFCGGFTTFSTTAYASVRLAQQGRPGMACLNGYGTLLLSVAAAAAGLAVTAP